MDGNLYEFRGSTSTLKMGMTFKPHMKILKTPTRFIVNTVDCSIRLDQPGQLLPVICPFWAFYLQNEGVGTSVLNKPLSGYLLIFNTVALLDAPAITHSGPDFKDVLDGYTGRNAGFVQWGRIPMDGGNPKVLIHK